MNKEFIEYEQALELKELGFGSVCFGFYNPRHEIGDLRANPLYEHSGGCFDNYNRNDYFVSAPLYQQAFRWFSEKYDLYAYVDSMGLTTGETVYDCVIIITDGEENASKEYVFDSTQMNIIARI